MLGCIDGCELGCEVGDCDADNTSTEGPSIISRHVHAAAEKESGIKIRNFKDDIQATNVSPYQEKKFDAF